jgi:hypothetical protein
MTVQTARPLHVIAHEIASDWAQVNYAAQPYLDAMHTLSTIDEHYYQDSASSIVAYFLSNATTWRGPVARTIKAELKAQLKGGR